MNPNDPLNLSDLMNLNDPWTVCPVRPPSEYDDRDDTFVIMFKHPETNTWVFADSPFDPTLPPDQDLQRGLGTTWTYEADPQKASWFDTAQEAYREVYQAEHDWPEATVMALR
jgi:hypothetical protein